MSWSDVLLSGLLVFGFIRAAMWWERKLALCGDPIDGDADSESDTELEK